MKLIKFEHSINFVDENNNFIGFEYDECEELDDNYASCMAGWFITESNTKADKERSIKKVLDSLLKNIDCYGNVKLNNIMDKDNQILINGDKSWLLRKCNLSKTETEVFSFSEGEHCKKPDIFLAVGDPCLYTKKIVRNNDLRKTLGYINVITTTNLYDYTPKKFEGKIRRSPCIEDYIIK